MGSGTKKWVPTTYKFVSFSSGGFGFADSNGNKYDGDNMYLIEIESALNQLASGPLGKNLVLEAIKNSRSIAMTERETKQRGKNDIGLLNYSPRIGGYSLSWSNRFESRTGLSDYHKFIGFGHEIGHAIGDWIHGIKQ